MGFGSLGASRRVAVSATARSARYADGVRPVSLPGSYLVIETTNQCSLACVHCTVSEGSAHPHHAGVGFLPLGLAENVFSDLRAVGAHFDTLIFFWLGEPLIHPEFGALYQLALRSAPGLFDAIEIHTNATHLGRDRVRIALNASPVRQTWHFSLDAVSAATYRRVKGRDELENVTANLDAFLDARATTGARWPRPIFQFIVGPNNVSEVAEFRARWQGACDKRGMSFRVAAQNVPAGDDAIIFFRQLDAPSVGEQEAANQVFREEMGRQGLALPRPAATPAAVSPGPGICGCFWKSPVIGWDGRVTTCTRDNRLENTIGNVHARPFSEIWWGEGMANHRRNVARGHYVKLPACDGCFIPRSANYSDISSDEIRSAT